MYRLLSISKACLVEAVDYNMQWSTLLTLACAACLISLSQARTMPWVMAPSAAPEGNATCPPPGLAPVDEFDVDMYISESW